MFTFMRRSTTASVSLLRKQLCAEKCFNTSLATLKALAGIYAPYAREMKKKGANATRQMRQDKDGKKILAFIDTMEKTLPVLQKTIKSRMRASV